jgi:hypothetical protein
MTLLSPRNRMQPTHIKIIIAVKIDVMCLLQEIVPTYVVVVVLLTPDSKPCSSEVSFITDTTS